MQVKYLSRMWNAAGRGDGFVLTYAETPPEHLVGRTLLVLSDGRVIECTRDGSATPGMSRRGEPVVVDNNPALYERLAKG